tara:strand:+ start:148 stop:789 length:642 start_codon:yes stop_codon:yes gene_type:complete
MSESLQEAINQVSDTRSKQEIISSALKEAAANFQMQETRVSKNALGMMGTRPETESPSGEMARAYASQGKRGTPEERYEKAKKKVERTSTQRTTGRSPKVKRETDKMNASIARSMDDARKRGFTTDSTDFSDRVLQGASDLLEYNPITRAARLGKSIEGRATQAAQAETGSDNKDRLMTKLHKSRTKLLSLGSKAAADKTMGDITRDRLGLNK